MRYRFRSVPTLKKLLWLDTVLGGTTAVAGLLFSATLAGLLGLSTGLILLVASVTLLYAVVACMLARQQVVSVRWLRTLIVANGLWTIVSLYLLVAYYERATKLGVGFLLLQVVVVGGLAYAEGRQLIAEAEELPPSRQ